MRMAVRSHRDNLVWSRRVGAVRPLVVEAAMLLRVAKEPGQVTDPEFVRWVETQKFTHPKTRNEVKFKSLPAEDQAKIRARWQQAKQQDGAQKGVGGKKEERVSPKKEMEEEAFTDWLGEADEKTLNTWQEGSEKERADVKQKWREERGRKPTTLENIEGEKRRERFKEWLGEQSEDVQEAYQSGDFVQRACGQHRFGARVTGAVERGAIRRDDILLCAGFFNQGRARRLLPLGERPAGRVDHLKRTHDPLGIGGPDLHGRCGIAPQEFGVELGRGYALGPFTPIGPDFLWNVRDG